MEKTALLLLLPLDNNAPTVVMETTDRPTDRLTDAVSWLADMTPEAINVMPEAYVGSGSVLMSIDNDT